MGDALRASADQSGHNQRLSNRRKERRDLPSNGTEAERVSYNVYVNNARRRARRRQQQMCSPAHCPLPRHLRANKRGSSEPTALAPAKTGISFRSQQHLRRDGRCSPASQCDHSRRPANSRLPHFCEWQRRCRDEAPLPRLAAGGRSRRRRDSLPGLSWREEIFAPIFAFRKLKATSLGSLTLALAPGVPPPFCSRSLLFRSPHPRNGVPERSERTRFTVPHNLGGMRQHNDACMMHVFGFVC